MRITLSLCMWLTLASATVLGVHGWVQLTIEQRNLQQTAEREIDLLTTSITAAIENAFRDGQTIDVTDLLEKLEYRDPELDVFVFDCEQNLQFQSPGSDPLLPMARDIIGGRCPSADSPLVRSVDTHIISIATIIREGVRTGRVVVLRSTDDIRADLAEEQRGLIQSICLVVLALSLTLFLVVHFRLHRPLRQIIHHIRSIASGNLTGRLRIPGKDEISLLAREFDEMGASLQQSRQQLMQEAEAREKMQSDMLEVNRMAIIGRLAASLAHEIGSPLQVLSGRARSLASRPDLPEDARRIAAITVEQTDRITRIVDRLMSVARSRPIEKHLIQIQKPVKQVIELLAPTYRRKGVELQMDIENVPPVMADPDQVQQVMLNLLQNALRASDRNTSVIVHVAPATFPAPSAHHDLDGVRITVTDQGIGIDPSMYEAIFEPFTTCWQNDSNRKGNGLGLTVTRSIAQDHGGRIAVSAGRDGRGACFTVEFPVSISIPPGPPGYDATIP